MYDWKFSTIGGVTRVCIKDGNDIAHLGELDQKLWTVLSCPATGLEIDAKTLSILDADSDGKIRVAEVVAASKWLVSVLKEPEVLTSGNDSLPLSAFNLDTEEGRRLYESSRQILENLGLDKDSISIADLADTIAIFAKTRFNGDGIVTPDTAEEPELKQLISDCMAVEGKVTDRSGADGVDAALVEKFYASAAAYLAWKDAGTADKFPYGEKTADALALCNSLKDKVGDFFMRCKLASFDSAATSVLDVSADRIAAISGKDLTSCSSEIASYPLAKVNPKGILPLSEGVNPAWRAQTEKLRSLVPGGADSIDEAVWNGIVAKFAPYSAWMDSQAGMETAPLGYDRLKEIVASGRKQDVLDLIAQDLALSTKAGDISAVDKLLHLSRDFFKFIRNYVTFSDFYTRDEGLKSVFQAGTLYMDRRSCDLCIKVSDMGKQAAMAPSSGMYIVYCDCLSKKGAAKMAIAAVVTDGEIDDLKVGKNGIFYDRSGNDWDATVTKIVDNPISIRQSFWSPYRKIGNFVEEQINKFASNQNAKVLDNATAKISSAGSKLAEAPVPDAAAAPAVGKQPFDIAKFCGLFAVIGMALGTICTFLLSLVTGFLSLSWWQMPLVIVALLLVVSGPSMVMAWLKLRKRDLAPLLNANGWAVNAKLIVNVSFGSTLTHMAKLPRTIGLDPFAEKKMSAGAKFVIILAIICVLAAALYFLWPLLFHTPLF